MEAWLLFLIGLIAMTMIFYIAVRIITQEDTLEFLYYFRLILSGAIVIFVAPFFQSITPSFMGPVGVIVAFVIILYTVRFLLVEPITSREEWEKTIWISLLAVSFAYLLNAATIHFLDTSVVPSPF